MSTTTTCTTCGHPADNGYVNAAAGERCVDDCHAATTVAASRVEVRTSGFEFAHGRRPRGAGAWAFMAGGETFWANGAYSDARRQAQTWAAGRGYDRVEVGS